MQHLFNSTVSILRQQASFTDGGMATRVWAPIATGVKCRLALHHRTLATKPERVVIEAGTVPDLTGTLFMAANTAIRAGDRVKFTGGVHAGRMFSVEDTPAMAAGYGAAHHLEWAVQEVSSTG